MTPQEFEDKFKAAEAATATGASGLFTWSQTHTSVVLVLAGVLVGLVLGFMLFR